MGAVDDDWDEMDDADLEIFGEHPDRPLPPLHHVYYGFDRKPCQVQLDDGTWVDAEIRAWDRDEHGAWSANVAWTRGPGQSSYLERFEEGRVRGLVL